MRLPKQLNVVIGTALLAGMLACPDRPGQPAHR